VDLLTNIRLAQNLPGTNAQAYYAAASVTNRKVKFAEFVGALENA
jgi:hypothetical protein